MRRMKALSVVCLCILVVMAFGARLDRGRFHIKVASLMFAMTNGACYAGLLVGLCVGSVKLRR